MFARDTLIATLIEKYRRIVAVVNDGITHQGCTLLPARSLHIFLSITGRHCLDQSHTVARLDILFPRGDVHPAYQISTRLHHQVIAVVTQPGRHRQAHSRPFVRGALGIAVHHQYPVVEPDLSLCKARLTETGAGVDTVNDGAVVILQHRLDRIEITIAPRPEMQSLDGLLDLHHTRLSWLHGDTFAIKLRHLFAVYIQHSGKKGERTRLAVLVADLRLCMDYRLVVGDVEIGSINIRTRSTEVTI